MDMKQDGQIIYLKDLLFAALYKWKTIVTIAVSLALVLGIGKGLLSFVAMTNADAQQVNAHLEEMEQEVYETKKATLQQQIDVNRENARHQQEYLSNSILMNIDPYNFYEVYLSVYVDSNYQIITEQVYQNPDLTNALISSYIEHIVGAQSAQSLADSIGTDPEYLLELVSTEAPYDTRTLVLRAKAADEASAQQLLNLLLQHIQKAQPIITESVGEHELRVKEQYTRQAMDKELAQTQQDQVDKLTELNDSILSLQEEKDTLVPPKPIVVSFSSVVKDAILFAVVGGILGVLIVVMIAWIRHFTSGKIYSARTLNSRTGLEILGCVCVCPSKNKLDHKLTVLEGRNTLPAEKQYALLAYSIGKLCGNAQKLLLTGQTSSDDRSALIDAMRQTMPGVQILDYGNLLEDLDARKALDPAIPVLLVEQCNVSSYASTEQTMAIIASHGAQLLGCVLLNG